MPKKQYGFREGSRFKGDPEKIGLELERLRKQHGTLTAESVVDAARDKDSPLHELWSWDVKKSAHRYWLIQARTLIRSIIVIVDNRPAAPQYFHVNVQKKTSGSYEPAVEVVNDEDLYQSALELLEAKVSSAMRAVDELRDAAGRSKKKGKLNIINLVSQSLLAANTAIKQLAN